MPNRHIDSQASNSNESTDTPVDADGVTTLRWNRRELLKVSGVGVVSASTAPLVASSDAAASEDGTTTISIDNVRANAWEVTSIDGDAAEAPIGEENPPITLDVGARHRVENGGWSAHPLEIRDENDEPLLSQDADVDGRFEADAAVEWVDNDDEVAFTLTEELAAACDSYICTVHGSMRGQLATTDADDGSPSEIEDWNDLNAVRENVDDDYELINDLDEDAAGYDEFVDTENGWEPIGGFLTDGRLNTFTGTFDGNGHEISDLYVDRPDDRAGLFGIMSGTIENIGVVDVDVTGSSAGGVVDSNRGGEIIDSYASGTVRGENNVGGLVGTCSRDPTDGTVPKIVNSYAMCDVDGESFNIGGLVGSNSGEIIESHSNQAVTGGYNVGGLIGYNPEGNIENSYATGDVVGEDDEFGGTGGLVGSNDDEGYIEESYATGDVTGKDEVGGLVGENRQLDDDDVGVEKSYATGRVSGEDEVGGLVGRNRGAIATSYSVGHVSGEDFVGGLVGRGSSSSVESSYWDTEASGQSDSEGGTGLTTEEMNGASAEVNLDQFDFDETWDVVTDPDGYPILQFQDDPEEERPEEAELTVQPLSIADVGPDDSFSVAVTIEETAGLAAENLEVALTVSPDDAGTTPYEELISIGELDAETETTVTFGDDEATPEVGPLTAGEYEATVEVAAANAETVRTSESFTVSGEPAEEPTAEDFITRNEEGDIEDVEVFDAIDDFRSDRLGSGELFDVISAFREA